MKKINIDMNVSIPDIYLETESCLYKLYYGDRYVILKGKTLAGSIYLIQKGYAYFIAGGAGSGTKLNITAGHKEGDGKNTYYFKFYSYIKKNPGLPFQVLVIMEDNNAYNLLKREQQELDLCIRDKKCLNSNVSAYIPVYRPSTKSHGWISKAHVLCFKKYLKQPAQLRDNKR